MGGRKGGRGKEGKGEGERRGKEGAPTEPSYAGAVQANSPSEHAQGQLGPHVPWGWDGGVGLRWAALGPAWRPVPSACFFGLQMDRGPLLQGCGDPQGPRP